MGGIAAQKWDAILGGIAHRIPEHSFRAWFSKISPKECTDGRLVIGVPNRFFKEWLSNKYMDVVQESASTVLGEDVAVSFSISGELYRKFRNQQRSAEGEPRRAENRPRPGLNPDFTLGSFVVGSCNRVAHAACLQVVEEPGKVYNPLFIHGGPGLGKTHLLHGVGHAVIESRPEFGVLYVSCEEFVNEFISSVRNKSLESFRSRYRAADVLIINDVHFLGAKQKSQEEFCCTFNALHNAGGQVVVSSDVHPKEIASLREKLVTRFISGVVTVLRKPDLETRLAILRSKARRRSTSVPDEVLQFLAGSVDTSVRELEGALARLDALSRAERKPPSIRLARAALRGLFGEREGPVRMEEILNAVASRMGVKAFDVRSRSRARDALLARQVCMYVSRRLTSHSLAEIGEFFGGRNHATVVHADRKIARAVKSGGALAELSESLIRSLSR